MKKTLLALLLAITLVAMSILPASAATGSLGATATLLSDGTSFTVDLIVKNNPGIIALTGKVTYDSKVFRLKAAQNGEIFESVFMSSQKISDNPYQMIWMEATASEDIETNGVLAKYTFEVLKNAPAGESEIKFEITETVNYAKDSTSQINGCSFKVKVGETAGTSSNGTVDTPNSQDAVTNDETLNVQKPLTDITDLEAVSSESQLSENTESTSSNTASDDIEDLDDGDQNNDRTLITVITIVAVLVLGLGITFTAIYFRKKAGSKENAE